MLISSYIPCITVSHYHNLLTLSSAMILSISCLEGRTRLLIKTDAVTEWSSARGVRPSNVGKNWEEGTMTVGLEHIDR